MNDTFRLGRIAGIPIGLNWSWLLVFVILVWSLASGVFPAADPGLRGTTYVAMGVAAVLLVFASLLLHELGHALEARREGIHIEGITLWLFGGVARFGSMFPSPGAEFRVAIAGPLVTAALGAAFAVLAATTQFAPAVDGVVAWLAYINLLLLGFNLLPALPLDGGRVFRAGLWRLRGDLGRATRIAVAVGRGFGALMIAAGIVGFFATGMLSGVWLALLGWFLLSAVGSESRLEAVRVALDGLVVADIMRADSTATRADQTLAAGLPTLTPDEPAVDAVFALAGENAERAFVVHDGRVVGVVHVADLEGALRPRQPWPGRRRDSAREAA